MLLILANVVIEKCVLQPVRDVRAFIAKYYEYIKVNKYFKTILR